MTVRKKHSQSLSFPYKAFVCPSQILIYKQLLASYNFSPAPNFWELFNFFMFCKHVAKYRRGKFWCRKFEIWNLVRTYLNYVLRPMEKLSALSRMAKYLNALAAVQNTNNFFRFFMIEVLLSKLTDRVK